MGHGDTIVIADGNFPAESVGKNSIVIRMDGHGVPEILDAVLTLMPLDQYVEKPVSIMERVPGDNADVSIWKNMRSLSPSTRAGIFRAWKSWSVLSSTMRQRKRMRL